MAGYFKIICVFCRYNAIMRVAIPKVMLNPLCINKDLQDDQHKFCTNIVDFPPSSTYVSKVARKFE